MSPRGLRATLVGESLHLRFPDGGWLPQYFVDTESPEYKSPWNQTRNIPRVHTPEDRAVQPPNSDTPYSFVGLDLPAEPMVLTVPEIEPDRYFSIQLVDLYTHNFATSAAAPPATAAVAFSSPGRIGRASRPRV